MALIKREILLIAKSCTRSVARVISSCFAEKMYFQNKDFSRLKCQNGGLLEFSDKKTNDFFNLEHFKQLKASTELLITALT